MKTMIELPSGRMVDLENIIYVSDIKERNNWLTNWDYEYSFDIIWLGGERVTLKFDNKDACVIEWENLKFILKKEEP